MRFFPKRNLMKMTKIHDHEEANKRLIQHEKQLAEMARRLRVLEIEAGIEKPPLRGIR